MTLLCVLLASLLLKETRFSVHFPSFKMGLMQESAVVKYKCSLSVTTED